MQNEKEIRYIDLFGGVGGFRLGIERANNSQETQSQRDKESRTDSSNLNRKLPTQRRSKSSNGFNEKWFEGWNYVIQEKWKKPRFTCVFYNDIDKYAVQTYNKNFKENYKPTDIRTIKTDSIPDFDLLCAGFPCQAFSIAGKRKGFEDTRGTLFYEIARILKAKRPQYFLLENVKGLLSHDRGRTFAIILSTLAELGYDVQWMVLNSKFFGVPQNRERVFIIGSLGETSRPEILPFGETSEEFNKRLTKYQIASSLQHSGHSGGNYKGMNMVSELNYIGAIMSEKNKQWLNDGKELSRNFPQGQRVYGTEGISSTIAGNAGGLGGKTGLYAVLTPDRENKRQDGRRFKEDGEPSFTLTGQDVHGVAIMDLYNKKEHSDRSPTLTEPHHNTLRVREGMKIRRLTPIECERLQGFPDNWTSGVSDTQRYKMMGNAVTVNVVQAIVERMFR